jgi:iron-sulfur cluster repair protein YtfE (RIC family)
VALTETEALDAMIAHHWTLEEKLQSRVTAVARAASGGPHELAVAELVAYLADDVLPHALAEEETIYPAAGERDDLAGLVSEMIAEHRDLASAAERLPGAPAAAAAEQATKIAALFTDHVAKENDILLPALLPARGASLAQLLGQMHRRAQVVPEATAPGTEPAGDADATPAADPAPAVLRLLLEAAPELARAGEGDRACRLAASAWAALRAPRPDLAARVTAALHGLARRAAAESVGRAAGLPGSLHRGRGRRQGRILVSTFARCPRRGAMSRSSPRTMPFPREAALCSSTTTIRGRCATSSRLSTPGTLPGIVLRPGRPPGGCASASRQRPMDQRVR